jgi:phosphoribosyl 1,2-cyclic phosphodiesterase
MPPLPTPSSNLRVCVLASGSSGNCIYVETPDDAILFDVGISAREAQKRMQLVGIDPSKIRAICISHEHTDHTRGLRVLAGQLGAPVYANGETARNVRDAEGLAWNVFANGSPFQIADVEIVAFSLPHDAYDPVGFVLSRGASRLGIATDLGMPTQAARERLRGCHLLVLEANHDVELVRSCTRPWSLKQRILGRQGHLSNEAAAQLLEDVAGDTVRQVFLAHLSRECNDPVRAHFVVGSHLASIGLSHVALLATHPDKPSAFAEC